MVVWRSASVLVLINLSFCMLGLVSTGMGDHVLRSTAGGRKRLPRYKTSHPCKLSLAIRPWVDTRSTSDARGHHEGRNGEFCVAVPHAYSQTMN